MIAPRRTHRLVPLIASISVASIACSDKDGADAGGEPPADATPQSADASADAGVPDAAPVDAGEGDGGNLPGIPPARRGDLAGAFRPGSGQVFMFFGDRGEPDQPCGFPRSDFTDDGWTFDGRTERWAELGWEHGMSAPRPRARSRGAWDATNDRFLVFGGRYRSGSSGPYTLMNDVWAYDMASASWSRVFAGGPLSEPRGRTDFTLVEDPARARLLLHGGNIEPDAGGAGRFRCQNDTWSFDLATSSWTRIQPNGNAPPVRCFHVGEMDRQRQRLYVFAGGGDTSFTGPFFDDLWYLDIGGDGAWHQVPKSGDWPSARIKGQMIYDEPRDRLVLFGGHDFTDLGLTNDLWSFDLASQTWTLHRIGDTYNRAPFGFCDFPANFTNVDLESPERREVHLFVAAGGKAYAFGGRTDCGLSNDTWELDLETMTWREINRSFGGVSCFRSGRVDCDDPNAKLCGG